nr:hypothetical protein [Bryobacterales bacterium]
GIFLLRALLALRDVGDTDLEEEAARHAWWRQAMYAGSFSSVSASAARAWLMSGVGGPAIGDEGWASLLLAFAPQDQLPYFLWWYNRHLGATSTGDVAWRFDPRRDGQVWAMLLYPSDVREQDPTGIFPSGITGSAGQVLLRNRWRNQGDVQVAVHADLRHHSHAWDQPEALSVHVLAHGETWLGGPGKETAPQHFSTLLVDGRHARDKGGVRDGGLMSKVLFFPQGALIAMEGGEQYRQLGVRKVERQVLVHFHPNSDDLLLSTLDRIESDDPHTYTWQANIGEPGQSRIVVRDRRFRPSLNQPFVLMGGGWPVCSLVGELPGAADAEGYRIRYGDPVRIQRDGASLEIWVQLAWRCVGGRTGPGGAIIESPHLNGTVGRDAQGNLALQLSGTEGQPAP